MIALLLATSLSLFTEAPVFQEPIAYPRSPETQVSVNSAKYLGHRIEYINAAIGRDLALATFGSDFQLQPMLEAGTWVSLGYDEGRFPLLTQDFYFGMGPAFKYGSLSGALKFNHISAHLGDGIDDLIYKTLTSEEKAQYNQAESFTGHDILLVAPKNYSRDFLSAQAAWDVPYHDLRLYLHTGYAHKMIPDTLKRWYFGGGLELYYPGYPFDYLLAQDTTWNQDTDTIDYSARTGIALGEKTSLYHMQIALTVYSGSDRRGQLVGRNLTQVGFGFFIQ